MRNSKGAPKYDLEDRTFKFAKEVRNFVNLLKKDTNFISDIQQVVRSSGSIGANYIEANESLGEKDFLFRLRIARKEAKETVYWLQLLQFNDKNMEAKRDELAQEASELMKILSTIMRKKEEK